MAAAIATWAFSLQPVEEAKQLLLNSASALDAIEKSISGFEDDINTGLYHVGRGGWPNSEGVAQYDAALMNGRNLEFGAVAALEGYPMPIKVARKVMTSCKHNVLVGAGARTFATTHGFECVDNDALLSAAGKRLLQEQKATVEAPGPSSSISDTIGLIALDRCGDIAVGVSSSGMSLKHPGRVGDSPLVGAGLYADNQAGAACCTGDGDEILKYCPSFHIVHLMRSGLSARAACDEVVQGIVERRGGENMLEMGVIAMDMQGAHGAAGTLKEWTDDRTRAVYYGFPYAIWTQDTEADVKTMPCIKDKQR